MKRKLAYEIKKSDVGKRSVMGKFGWIFLNFMGRILEIDVGKRIYLVDEIYQVENQEQLERRQSE